MSNILPNLHENVNIYFLKIVRQLYYSIKIITMFVDYLLFSYAHHLLFIVENIFVYIFMLFCCSRVIYIFMCAIIFVLFC